MSADLIKGIVSTVKGAATSATNRIHPETPQQPDYPLIRYQLISTARQHSLNANVGVTEATMQFDCMADSKSDAWALADEMRVLLHGYRGALGVLTSHLISLITEDEFTEREGDRVTHWVTQRYRVWTDMD